MTSKEVGSARDVTRLQNAAAGGVLGAIAASSCCMLPLLLFTLGASGPWIGTLVRLAPYQPYFIAVAVACLGCGYWLVYRSSRSSCGVNGRASNQLVKSALILATVLVIAAMGFD